MRPKSKPKSKPDAKYSKACVFCCSEEENEEAYGKMLRKSGITIHYFCMLFSSGLWQRGKRDQDGILGFLPADIRREQKRGLRLTCQYCKKKGATIGCCVSSCRKTFHFRCGREAGGMSQFFQEFRSYCPEHRPRQVTPTSASDRLAFYGTAKSTCSICMLAVEARSSNDTLRSPCCRNAWFHRDCIQRYAVTAGAYFFKCPLCNNKDLFESEMLQFGIYIPEQDAAWEQEPNAYQELLERYNHCDADKCLCPQGREHDGSAGTRWELMLCMWCGSSGSHFGCRAFTKVGKDRVCSECFEISAVLEKDKKKKKRSVSSPRQTRPSLQEIRHEVQQRRSTSLRAQRLIQQDGSPPPDSRGQQPSTSERSLRILRRQQAQCSIAAFAPLSVNAEETRVVSPSLLQDRRLTASIPVVRVERADSEVEVNVTDSDEEEASGSASEVLNGSGCARLRGLPEPSLARLRGGPRQVAATWDVKGVIEKGQRKVVLLSMLNQQGYSSDSSVQSTTSAIQTCLRLRSKLQDSEMEGTDNQQELQSAKGSHQHRRGRPRKVSEECGPERDSQNTRSSNTSQKRGRGRPRKIKHHFLSKNIQYGSDDNNNFSAENSSVDRDSFSPAPSTSKSSPRRTRSVTLNRLKRGSDSSSEERDCDVSLAQLGVKRRRVTRGHGNVESEKRLTETKGKSQHEYQSSSPDSSTSAESLTTKVRYRRALQRASRSSRQHSKLGIDDNAESHDGDSKSKSHLSTDVQGLQSRTLAMTPDSKLGSSFEQDHDSTSTVKMSDVGPEGEVHPVAEETERKFRPAEAGCERGSLKVANDRDFHSLAAASGEIARTGEKGDSSVSTMSGNPSRPGVYESAASMSNQDTTGTKGSAVPDAFYALQSPVPSAYAQFQVPRPQLKKAGHGLGANSASAVPVSWGLSVPPPLISYTEARGGTHPDLKASTQPCVGSPSNAQPHQLGGVAAPLHLGSVSATRPYPVTVVAVQPHHAVPRMFSTMASSSASFTQWIGTLRDCYHSQPQAEEFLTATQPHGAVVVPTTQLPSVAASIAQPHPAVVTSSQPYPATVTLAPTLTASAGQSDPYPLSLVPGHLLPVPPNLAQPPALAQAVSGECSQTYLGALTTARVSQQNPAPVSVTSTWSAPAVMRTRQSAPATHQQTSALQASQAVPVPGSLYVAAGSVAPVPELHSTRSGRRVSSNPEVPVPVSLFHSSDLASAPIPSSAQQPASIAQPSSAASRVSLQAVNTSQASTASYNSLQQQLTAAPNCYQDPNMLPSAGHFRQTVPRALRDRVTRLAGAQTPVGNQQNRLALPLTAAPVVMRPLVSQPAPAERSQQGGWTVSQSTHPEAERSQHGEWTAGRSAHPGKSRHGKWAASQLTHPEGSQQGGWTASQSTHPEGSHGEWTASWSTHPDGSQQGGWTASQSTRPVRSQTGTARQSARPQGSQQRQASGHPPAAAASQQRVRRDGMSAPQSQSSAPSRGQQVMSSVLPAEAQPGTGSTQQENVLPSSRGKIWLSPEPMQTMLCKEAEVVVLSDSDDSDAELRITGTSTAQVPVKTTASCRRRTHSHAHSHSSHMTGSCQSKPESGGGSGHPGSGHRPVVSQPVAPSPQQSSGQSQQPGRIATGTTPSSTQLTSSASASHKPTQVAPAYNRPPCPVHGYSRLVPRRRKLPIGPLTIDLTDTDKELAAKKTRFAEPEMTLSSDSDVEIIS